MHLIPRLALLVCVATSAATARADDACRASYERAQERRLDGDLAGARQDLLVCAAPSCPSLTTRDCARWLREVESELATALVSSADAAGRVIANATITLDARPVTPGEPIWLNAGEHVLACESGGARTSRRISIERGAHGRSFVCEIPPLDKGALPAEPRATSSTPMGAFVVGGAGVAAVLVGAVLAIKGVSDRSSLESSCAPHCSLDSIQSAHATLVAADVTVGVGLAALAGGALWLVLGRGKASSSAPAAVSPTQGLRLRF